VTEVLQAGDPGHVVTTAEQRQAQIERRDLNEGIIAKRDEALQAERAADAVEPLDTLAFLEQEAITSTVNIEWDPEGRYLIPCRIMTSGEMERVLKKIDQVKTAPDDDALTLLTDVLTDLKGIAAGVVQDAGIAEFFGGPNATYNQAIRLLNRAMASSLSAGATTRSFRKE